MDNDKLDLDELERRLTQWERDTDAASYPIDCDELRALITAARRPKPDREAVCSLGIGCEQSGVCYASAHDQPEGCGRALSPAQAEREGKFGFEAQLAERLADPEWVAKWNADEVERLPFEKLLHGLRGGEGSSVTLLCDNPDFNGQPSNAIEVCGEWTNWEDRRFTGDTLHAAVLNAYRAILSAAPKEDT